jgi:hypothetical protein
LGGGVIYRPVLEADDVGLGKAMIVQELHDGMNFGTAPDRGEGARLDDKGGAAKRTSSRLRAAVFCKKRALGEEREQLLGIRRARQRP